MKTQIPYDPATIQKFLDYLEDQGATMIELTNEWEVARYRMPGGTTQVVYKTKIKGHSGSQHLSFSSVGCYVDYNKAIPDGEA